MTDIRVPKLNNNDTSYILIEWLVEDGQQIKAGDPVAVLETSKATEELVSEEDGFLWQALPLNADCPPGALIARLTSEEVRPGSEAGARDGGAGHARSWDGGARDGAAGDGAAGNGASGAEPLITAPAQALIDQLGIDLADVRALGVSVVRRADIERLAATRSEASTRPEGTPSAEGTTPAAGLLYELSRVQRAVARAVRTSHEIIPTAYTVVKTDVGAALELAGRLTREVRRPVGLPELVTHAVARMHEEFPLFYATLVDQESARLAEAPHVGVTIDTGAGLYVPVIHDAGRRSIKEIASRLMEYRLAALTGDFREDDLAGANIAVTLHHDGDVTLAIPLIFPGHVCALAVTSPQAVLQLEGGQVVSRSVANIGLSYDHRLINGRDAGLFLRALKTRLESPAEVFSA
ncbi:2-oxo acid dehydrogenase subunit E2 [Planotetraspora sp. A-T 1434]|uniref:2-oxo acid dehydrogenase subunit E2 n=1 Tax=Planotetraspora sp. A-T 1434 TaxID=2979219 RepID=UPI0021BFAE26|nr:2-oxo acid dehydrogenase subunit E2 [Planotetraspora sp. A-T 1434]MCT9932897.1 2-oxo acid dehydrogenase subunit E2 [Planotetraspora sp. A-T 1434]